MKEYQQLKDLITSMEEDMVKFAEKGNALAGARVRKILQEIKKTAQTMRFAIQVTKEKE